MNTNDIRIKIFLGKTNSETLAYVQLGLPVQIDGIEVAVNVSNFRIMTSHYGNHDLKVLPPAIKTGGKYRDIFYLENKELWYKLEQKILKEYQSLLDRNVFGGKNSAS